MGEECLTRTSPDSTTQRLFYKQDQMLAAIATTQTDEWTAQLISEGLSLSCVIDFGIALQMLPKVQ